MIDHVDETAKNNNVVVRAHKFDSENVGTFWSPTTLYTWYISIDKNIHKMEMRVEFWSCNFDLKIDGTEVYNSRGIQKIGRENMLWEGRLDNIPASIEMIDGMVELYINDKPFCDYYYQEHEKPYWL